MMKFMVIAFMVIALTKIMPKMKIYILAFEGFGRFFSSLRKVRDRIDKCNSQALILLD